MLAFASVPVAAWLGVLTIEQLLACALLGGCAAVFFQTSYQVFLPSLLDGDELAAANALMHGSQSAAQVGGPGLAGLVASAVGAVAGVLLNAVSFLVSAACLLSLRDGERPQPTRSPRRCGARSPRGPDSSPGTLTADPDDLGRALELRTGRLSGGPDRVPRPRRPARPQNGRPADRADERRRSARSDVAPQLGRRLGSARAFIGFELIAAPAALLIPLAGPGTRAGLFAVGGFLVVAGVVGGNVLNGTWGQTYTPHELRGRVSTCSGLINYGGVPLGALSAGALATGSAPTTASGS